VIGIPLGVLYENAGEWVIHKYVLHGWGRNKTSPWSFHWHEHHRNVRQRDHIDPTYERSLLGWHAQSKEALGLVLAGLAHAPLLPIAPFFTTTVWGMLIYYHRAHKRSHQDTAWARRWVPWHYDHHMGPNQDANWCVTLPIFDLLMGTREPYAGTEREAKDLERRASLRERVKSKLASAAA
jgi:sterol desaturase/sphingolipid hydroxylase (fatty acid hydroxylase superfamily)